MLSFGKIKTKYAILLLTLVFLLAACSPNQNLATPTQSVSIDCESSWTQEITDEQSSLAFSLELQKHQFRTGELIYSALILKNMGSTPIWVNKRMAVNQPLPENQGEIYFVMLSPWGETAQLRAIMDTMGGPEAQDFVLLKSGDVIESMSEGIMYYSFPSLLHQKDGYKFSEGKYCIWAVYHNQTNPGLNGLVWTGKIKTNLVEFEVVK
jgi:hypothetical protein